MLKSAHFMAYQSIKQWPESERPRERLLRFGAHNLSDAQLLAIILRTGGGGKSALDLAIELLNSFGSLNKIDHASFGECTGIKGMGKAKVAQIKAALELGRRLLGEHQERKPYLPREPLQILSYTRGRHSGTLLKSLRLPSFLHITTQAVIRHPAVKISS